MIQHEPLNIIIGEIFNVDPATLTDATSHDDIEGWDSFGMVNLIAELEQRFGVEFDLLEVAEFNTIGTIRLILIEKGVAL